MLSIAFLAGGLLAICLTVAAVLRARIWSDPPEFHVPAEGKVPRHGTLLEAADVLSGSDFAVAGQLVDWNYRGVITLEALGESVSGDIRTGTSGGASWLITLADSTDLPEDERMLLSALFDDDAPVGSTVTLLQRDQGMREVLQRGLVLARKVREQDAPERETVASAAAISLWVVASVASVALVIAIRLAAGPEAATSAAVFAGIAVIAVVALSLRRSRLTQRAATFRTEVRALDRFIAEAEPGDVTEELLGWSLISGAPEPWRSGMPPHLRPLADAPASFRPIPPPNYDTTIL